MAIVGIDNGVTGSIGFIHSNGYKFIETPIKICFDFQTSKKRKISRLDYIEFSNMLKNFNEVVFSKGENLIIYLERPLINPKVFNATISAVRCFEAELIVIEYLKLPLYIIDSKAWQRKILPKGLKTKELKKASLELSLRTFPKEEEKLKKHKDGDGLLIARYGLLIENGKNS